MTAEVAYVCDEAEARALTEQIKGAAERTWALVERAYKQRAWSALGYGSWDAYCSAEFGTTRLRLPREERSEVVASLRDAGLSVRAIAAATGDSVGTVHHALSGVQNRTPESEPAPFVDRRTGEIADSPAEVPAPQVAADDDDVVDAEVIDEPVRVTGTDGRSYAARTDRKPPRRSLVEVAKTRGFALRQSTDSLLRVFDDDRYRTNEKQVADVLRGHLLYVAETVAAVLDQLP